MKPRRKKVGNREFNEVVRAATLGWLQNERVIVLPVLEAVAGQIAKIAGDAINHSMCLQLGAVEPFEREEVVSALRQAGELLRAAGHPVEGVNFPAHAARLADLANALERRYHVKNQTKEPLVPNPKEEVQF
jgi:hypothetical protein